MALPDGIQTVTVHGTLPRPDGSVPRGPLIFTPGPRRLTSAAYDVIMLGAVTVWLDAAGHFTVTLLATDAEGVTPSGWTYTVTERIQGAPTRSYPISLPAAAPLVDLADIAPTAPSTGEYVVVTGPRGAQGPPGDTGPQGEQGAPGDVGPTGAAGTPGTQGVKGDTGATGPKGDTGAAGATGAPGADGWGTQATYDALADRVTAVESAFTSVNAILNDLAVRVGGEFGLENRMTSAETRISALETP